MKHRRVSRPLFAALAILVVAGAFAFAFRGSLRSAYREATAPVLPTEEAYEFIHVPEESLPVEKRLAVPFTSQAPHANWDMPYQEACEEASLLMVAAYYAGESGVIPPNEADKQILDIVAFQEKELGFYKDTTAAETAEIIEARYPDLRADVLPLEGAEQIKQFIAQGIPVIIPADGKTLPNPNFRNGGPLFHMLVVRGYTPTQFITNDPGTRLGENFLYTYDGLLDSVHDWNDGDVPNGDRVILVVRPR
jgi:hypothetical protein